MYLSESPARPPFRLPPPAAHSTYTPDAKLYFAEELSGKIPPPVRERRDVESVEIQHAIFYVRRSRNIDCRIRTRNEFVSEENVFSCGDIAEYPEKWSVGILGGGDCGAAKVLLRKTSLGAGVREEEDGVAVEQNAEEENDQKPGDVERRKSRKSREDPDRESVASFYGPLTLRAAIGKN
ncbi:hypothetical protein GWI33_008404 [Rhynchophorus ferrugineus]|uniref:Uncharacterized protein n=1 Tax=Rhynchophorus ferrugineus TaxID=354439 RepID=A0A834IR36_RHYFE|nr:hypothetical protein GWI33_008404 [Rhynchophorus ferrugineus]